MAISVHIPAALRPANHGRSEIGLKAHSVRDALQQLERDYPALYHSVCDETGQLRRHINLFVNTSLIRGPQALDTALRPGDVLFIMTAVSGG